MKLSNGSYSNSTDHPANIDGPNGTPSSEPRATILMLEDDAEFAAKMQILLEDQAYGITTVANGADGIRHILTRDYDVILCDLMMPALSGDMFYLAVERAKPHLCQRFIFMSGYKDDPKWVTFIKKIQGVVLWKPFQFEQLQMAIDTVLYCTKLSGPKTSS